MKRSPLTSKPGPICLITALVICVSISFHQPAFANPAGANIRHGDIQIVASGNTLQILQSTSRGIIDWNSFSIQNGEVTRFVQPGASSATLNRVTGQSMSRIDGSLLANGKVLLLNPNGILFGRNGVVDTAGFTASTLDLSNEAFLAGGDLRFQGDSTAGIVNLGSINAVDGDVFLIASSVLNEGTINAANGTVGLAAGNDVLIAESGSERVFVRGAGTATEDSGVINRGTVNANVAELKSYGGNIYGMAVRNEGRVAATAVTREGGQIFLRAGGGRVRNTGQLVAEKPEVGGDVVVDAGPSGETEVGGTIDASGGTGKGGGILILGSTINVFEDSLIIADGDSGGGRILVGGGRRGQNPDFNNAVDVTVAEGALLSADADELGTGGEIIIFADNRLEFSGRLSATGGSVTGDGGFAELSGKNEVIIPGLSGRVDLSAAAGRGGTLLFDPNNIVIEAGFQEEGNSVTGSPASSNTLFAGDISTFLEGVEGTGGMSLIIETDSDGTGGSGDISFVSGATIGWSTGSDLTITADRDYIQNTGSKIIATGDGRVSIGAGRSVNISGTGTAIQTDLGDIELNGNTSSASGNSSGIVLDGASLSSVDGNITMTGLGGAGVFGNRGILLQQGASVQTTGTGAISISGDAGAGDAGQLQGVGLVSSLIESSAGDIFIRGTGSGTASIPADSNNGIDLFASTIRSTGSGNISLEGFAGDSPGDSPGNESVGVRLIGASAIETAGGGSITLNGTSGVPADSVGIRLNSTQQNAMVSDSGNLVINTDSIDLISGDLKSSGELMIRPLLDTSDINIGAGALDEGLQLDQDELLKFTDGFEVIRIGLENFGSGDFNMGETTFIDPVVLSMSGVGGTFRIDGDLKGADDASITLRGVRADNGGSVVPATTYLGADIITEGNAVTIEDDIVVKGEFQSPGRTIDTTGGGLFSGGADVTILGTVEGGNVEDFPDFEINAGTSGTIDLKETVGTNVGLRHLTFMGNEMVVGNEIRASGSLGITVSTHFALKNSVEISGGDGVTIQANRGATLSPGDFSGIEIGGTISSSSGGIELSGIGGEVDGTGDEAFFDGNRGVWLRSTSSVSAEGNINIFGSSRIIEQEGVENDLGTDREFGVVVEAPVTSENGSIQIESGGGDVLVGGLVSAPSGVTFTTSDESSTTFLFEAAFPSTEGLQFNGGTGTADTVDFSDSGATSNHFSSDQFGGIEFLIGNAGDLDEFFGSDTSAATFSFSGENAFDYSDEGENTIAVSGIEVVHGGPMDDSFEFETGGSIGRISGGTGENSLDFSNFGEAVTVDLELAQATGVDEFSDIDKFVGATASSDNEFIATNEDDELVITGESRGYLITGRGIIFGPVGGIVLRTVDFDGFQRINGGIGDDQFVVELNGSAGTSFNGTLDGSWGDDTFEIRSGTVSTILGGSNMAASGDTLDLSALEFDVTVDLNQQSATSVDFFDGVETFVGGMGTSTMIGSNDDDEVLITGDGTGSITVPFGESESEGEIKGEFVSTRIPDFQPNTYHFTDFDIVSGAEGADLFSIQVPQGESFSGSLLGDAGEDEFIISPGGGVAVIDGGAEVDTLDFSGFGAPVSVNVGSRSATQVGVFDRIEKLRGGSGVDTLFGTSAADQFVVESDNGGFLNSGSFDSFEILRGQGGTDRFTFQNQATVSSFFGGSGTDTFVLDDRNLTGTNTYVVTGNSVTRNPVYLFSEIELVQLLLGPGNDTVETGENGFVQVFNGGGGDDTIDFGTTPVTGQNPFLIGNSQIFETQFENFILVRDESNNPENITQQGAGLGGNQGTGSLVDQFTNTGGFAEALGNAFGAIAGNAIIAGQASVLQVEGGQVETPLSLDGFFTQPPEEVVGLLDESLEITAWTELADALGFGGATILVNNDGPYSILLDGVPPNEILPVLLESLQAEAGRELFEALEMTLVVPITSDDGAVSILAIPVQIEPAVLQLLVDNLNNEAFSELTAALED